MDKDVMKAIEDTKRERPTVLLSAFVESTVDSDSKARALSAAFNAFADSLRLEADLWTNSKRKGWQSTATRLRDTAATVKDVAAALDKAALTEQAVKPPTDGPNPHRAPLDPNERMPAEGFVYREPTATPADVPPVSDSLAYLRGDTDVLPAVTPTDAPVKIYLTDANGENPELIGQAQSMTLPPKTIIHLDDAGEVFVPSHVDLHQEAREMTQSFPIQPAAMAGITGPEVTPGTDPFSDPKPPQWNGGRYIPTGGRLYTFADLMRPPAPSLVPKHWSWSQLESSEDCAVQYRIGRIEGAPQVPQWANIGGDAFHSATEYIDRGEAVEGNGTYRLPEGMVSDIWQQAFNKAIADVAATSPVPIDRWRASNSGKENQDWWRVEGEAMLAQFVEQRMKLAAQANPRKLATLPTGNGDWPDGSPENRQPAIEWPFFITVDGPMGQLSYAGIIDRVWECADGTLLVEDLKSGSRMPQDTAQLGSYAWGVAMMAGNAATPSGLGRIMGTFYNARKGVWTPAVDLLAAHPWDELVFRLHAAEAKRRAGLYTPHVSNFCVSCSVAYACPLRNREGSTTS